MSMRFANRTVVITGAAAGIGLACAGLMLDEGASVVLADIDEAVLSSVIDAIPKEFSKRAMPVVCDVGNGRQVDALMGYAVEHFGSLDALVCAAATVHRAPFPEIAEDDFDRVIRTNLKGAFLCAQAAAKTMIDLRDRGKDIIGSITLLSDDDAFAAIPGVMPHVAAAGGVDRMVKTLARTLGGWNIRINSVRTGPVDTQLLHLATGTGKTALAAGVSRTAYGRSFDADEIAKIIAFAASSDAVAVTGQNIGTGAL